MQAISTTQLRTKSKDLIATLLSGRSVDLIHRSKVIGEVKPSKKEPKTLSATDIEKIIKIAKSLKLPKLTDRQLEANYRRHIVKKYGKGLP